VDAIVEPQPLWEYPSTATGLAQAIAVFPIESPVIPVTASNSMHFDASTNAIVFWMQWRFGQRSMSSGLIGEVKPGDRPAWSPGHRQGVFFFGSRNADCQSLIVSITFQPETCEMNFTLNRE